MEVASRYGYHVLTVPGGFKLHQGEYTPQAMCGHIAHDTVEGAVCCPVAMGKINDKYGFRRKLAKELLADYAKRCPPEEHPVDQRIEVAQADTLDYPECPSYEEPSNWGANPHHDPENSS